MTHLRAILAILAILVYPLAALCVFAIIYAQAPGKPLTNAWNEWRRR